MNVVEHLRGVVVASVRYYDFGVRKECLRPSILAVGRRCRHPGGGWRLYSAPVYNSYLRLAIDRGQSCTGRPGSVFLAVYLGSGTAR